MIGVQSVWYHAFAPEMKLSNVEQKCVTRRNNYTGHGMDLGNGWKVERTEYMEMRACTFTSLCSSI